MKIRRHQDERGVLESLRDLTFSPKEVLVASNKKGTLKGLHVSPYRKLVYVSHGKIHDFFVENSPSGPCTEKIMESGDWILVPALAGHGFYCEQDSLVLYFLEDEYDPSQDRVVYWDSPEFLFSHTFPKTNLIISQRDNDAFFSIKYDYVVMGASGFIGNYVMKILREKGYKVLPCTLRLDDLQGLERLLKKSQASSIICCAGISGKPTIQWSEEHETETFETNVLDACNLIRLCILLKKHLTYMGSGLVYSFREGARTESELPDWTGKVYCRYRVMLEDVIRRNYMDHVLYLRILYPCSFDGHPSCFFEKMQTRRQNVHENMVSLTILPDLLPLIPDMIFQKMTGILNFVNPGSLTLPELLEAGNVVCSSSSSTPLVSEVLDTTNLVNKVGHSIPNVLESVRRHAASAKKVLI